MNSLNLWDKLWNHDNFYRKKNIDFKKIKKKKTLLE